MKLFNQCLFTILAFSHYLQVCVSECFQSVLARRESLYVPEGGEVSLSCDVQHCGQEDWTGGWGITENGHFTLLVPSSRVYFSNETITENTTRLHIVIQNIKQSDAGAYQCKIDWQTTISQGHVITVNVTAAVRCTERKLSHRLVICGATSLFAILLLSLTCCFGSDDQSTPAVPPHPRNSSTARVKPKAEVTYAALVLSRPKQQSRAPATEATVYSSMKFSEV